MYGFGFDSGFRQKSPVVAGSGVITASVVIFAGGTYTSSDGSHAATQSSSNGSGTGAEFTVTISGDTVTTVDSVDTPGTGYGVSEQIVLSIPTATEVVAGKLQVDSIG